MFVCVCVHVHVCVQANSIPYRLGNRHMRADGPARPIDFAVSSSHRQCKAEVGLSYKLS